VAPRRLVRRNALVLVKASTGGFELTLNAKALADGASGDVIPVENLSSRGRLLALVTGENELSLVETEGR
jgi:flagella basal body P-ring formation protein FlgA